MPDDDVVPAAPASPVTAARASAVPAVQPVTVGAAVATALVLLVAATTGYAAVLGTTLVLALVLAWCWPVLGGSVTPRATAVVLALSALAIVPAALRDDLRWSAAAVAFGLLLSFFAQLLRRTGREGLVLTLLASFGGLVLITSATTAVASSTTDRGSALLLAGMAAAAVAGLADLLGSVRRLHPFLVVAALVLGVLAAALVATRTDAVSAGTALALGAAAGVASFSFRRVAAEASAGLGVRGQVAAGVGSVLLVGALVRLFTVVG
ncbi:MAG: hypothetical protein ABIS35_12265 [Terracoccus sp.]